MAKGGARGAIRDIMPYFWEQALRKNRIYYDFCEALYASMPKRWKNSMYYKCTIQHAKYMFNNMCFIEVYRRIKPYTKQPSLKYYEVDQRIRTLEELYK